MFPHRDVDRVAAGNWPQDVNIEVHCLIARHWDWIIAQMYVVNVE